MTKADLEAMDPMASVKLTREASFSWSSFDGLNRRFTWEVLGALQVIRVRTALCLLHHDCDAGAKLQLLGPDDVSMDVLAKPAYMEPCDSLPGLPECS